MRKLLLILLVLSSFVASSQRIQKDNTYGREFNRVLIDTLFGLPKDTFTVPLVHINNKWWAEKDGSLYRWDTASYTWRIYGTPTQACPPNGVLNGSASVSWQGTGYNFSVAPGLYMIDCVPYTSDSGSVTLSTADPDFDRFDVIYLGTDGAFHVLEGEPSASAAIPQVQGDDIALTAILVPAGSTAFEPDEQIVYDENTESVITNTGTTTNGANATNVFTGSLSANVTNINNGDLIFFTKSPGPSTWDITGIDILTIHIKLKAVMPTLGNLRVALYNGTTTPVSAEIATPINRNNITSYQAISIPISAFGNITTTQFTQLRFRYTSNNANNYTGFYLDYISFVDNLPTLPPTGAQVNLTLNSNGNAIVINPSNQIQNGGTWNLLGGGTSSQYVDGTLTVRAFPTLLDSVGALDGRAKSSNGGTIDMTTGTYHNQLANDLYPGLLSAALYTKLNRNDSITNLGAGDTLLVYVSDTLLGIKSLIAGANITLTPSSTGITIAASGGGAASYEAVIISSNYTVADGVTHVQLTAGSGGVTVTLPAASSWPGRMITIGGGLNNNTTISPAFLSNNGGTLGTLYAGASIDLISNGTNWIQVIRGTQMLPQSYALATGEDIFDGFLNANTNGQLHSPVFRKIKAGSGITVTNTGNAELEIAASGGSSSLFPTTGTGTATGNVIGNLAGNDLTIDNAGTITIEGDIIGQDGSGNVKFLIDHTNDDYSIGDITTHGINIDGATNAIAYKGATHTYTGPLVLNGATSGSVIVNSDALGNALNGTTLSGAGYVGATMYGALSSDFTMSDVNTVQPVFPTGFDVWTLQGSTTYFFEGTYILTHNATSHSVGMSFELAGGASVTSINYYTLMHATAINTPTASQFVNEINVTTNTALNTAGANAIETIRFWGVVRVNAGGTFTPSITFSAAPGGTCLARVGTYIKFTPIGTNTATNLGNAN